ncbi:MAG TPA: NEW3 domain-containing protein [Gemmatimonadaceae bacterium]|nr:NEW3 domain-containing protein [Gemmatimonadaceae bacterium]
MIAPRRAARRWAAGVACLLSLLAAGGSVAGAQRGAAAPYSMATRGGGGSAARAALAAARARLEYERAAEEFDRARELHRRRMVSDAELDARRLDAERARIAYVEESLDAALAAPHVMVARAAKARAPDGGRTTVRVTIRNASYGAALSLGAAASLGSPAAGAGPSSSDRDPDVDATIRRAVGAGEIRDVFVSLKADPGPNGTTISVPYERHVASLPRGAAATVAFELYRDVPELVVSVTYADRVEERRVFLDRDAGAPDAPRFAVQSAQPSLEADLGAQAFFDLRVDRLAAGDAARLVADVVPAGVSVEFRDPDSKARLTQIRFADGEDTRRLQLVLALPQRATTAVRADVPFRFVVAARGGGGAAKSDADDTTGGVVLELVPRGLPRVELRAVNLYHELAAGDSMSTEVVVRNSGSRPLEALQLRADAPPEWRVDFSPSTLAALPVDTERPVRVVVHAPADASVGDYEARVRVASSSADRRLETEDKVLRLHVADRPSPLGTFTALAVAVVAGVGAVVVGRRWMRR